MKTQNQSLLILRSAESVVIYYLISSVQAGKDFESARFHLLSSHSLLKSIWNGVHERNPYHQLA